MQQTPVGAVSNREQVSVGAVSNREQVSVGAVSNREQVSVGAVSNREQVSVGAVSNREQVSVGAVSNRARLQDKIAIITGAASGIGKATAILFAQHGASIVVADIDSDGGNQTADDIRSAGGEAIYIQADVTIARDTEWLIQETVRTYGRLDILFNNAGIAMRLPVAELPEADWHRCLAVNLTGVYLCAKAAIPEMQKNGGGSIINMSSIYGIVGADVRAAYVASKGGVTNLTRGMALDYAKDNIRVNCICPGFVETPLVAGVVKTPAEYQKLADKHPMRRLGKPEEIAYGALYLASDESAFVTGIALPIDGGYTAG